MDVLNKSKIEIDLKNSFEIGADDEITVAPHEIEESPPDPVDLAKKASDLLQMRIFIAIWVVTFGVVIALGVVM